MSTHLPRYPVYVISKGRHDCCLTARFLVKDNVPFRIVVEPQEAEHYAAEFGAKRLITTPFSNLGQGGTPARNFVWEHAKAEGHERHWILDDNIDNIQRVYRGHRIRCAAGPAFAACEDFTDRYENIAIAGMNYSMFIVRGRPPPFVYNCHVYSCLLIRNDLDFRWRGQMNEDTDLSLTALARGWCTILFNAFVIRKRPTMTMKGGNSIEHYAKADGRLLMAKILEREWPYIVKTKRRFNRPQHVVRNGWKNFDTPLRLKAGVDLSKLPFIDNYGLNLKLLNEAGRSVFDKVKDST